MNCRPDVPSFELTRSVVNRLDKLNRYGKIKASYQLNSTYNTREQLEKQRSNGKLNYLQLVSSLETDASGRTLKQTYYDCDGQVSVVDKFFYLDDFTGQRYTESRYRLWEGNLDTTGMLLFKKVMDTTGNESVFIQMERSSLNSTFKSTMMTQKWDLHGRVTDEH